MTVRDIIVIGGSAGAVEAIRLLAEGLPGNLPAAVFAVVHFPESANSVLPRILERAGPLPAAHATNGQAIEPGRVYVAPPGMHLLLNQGEIVLSRGAKENGHRPAIDPLFRTAARAYGSRVIGVLLSGNLDDGSAGLQRIQAMGGATIVQDPETALYRQMPENALTTTRVDHIVSPAEIGPLLGRLAGRDREEIPMPDDLNPRAGDDDYLSERTQVEPDGIPSTFTCPECHGALWEVPDGELERFRCRVGHAYNPDSLLSEQADALEAALWTGLRALEEHVALSRRMATRAERRGNDRSAVLFRQRAHESEERANIIRRVLHDASEHPAVITASGS